MRYCFSRSLVARQLIRRRLGLVLLVALFVCGLIWVSEARADPTITQYQTVAYYPAGHPWYNDKASTCTAAGAVYSAQAGFTAVGQVSANQGYCDFVANNYIYASTQIVTRQGCWDMSTPVGGVCPAAPPGCSDSSMVNKYVGASAQGTGTSLPSTVCIQGCSYSTGSVGVQVGSSYATDIGKGTGATCTGANYDVIDTTTQKTDPPSLISCAKKGQVYGTVNGVGICAAAGTIPNSTVKQQGATTTQATDASGVQAAAQTAADSTTVSNVNGVPSVTKTVTNPDGSKSSTTEDQAGYCAKNPNDQVCKKSESTASGGADCGAAPSCSGDAIQCMMVNQQWHTRCDSNQPNSLSDLGSKLVNGQDPISNPADSANRVVKPVGSSIDQTAFLGGSGLSDKLVTVSGQTITLPFSKLNQYLVWIGHLFVVLSLIGAVRIVVGGFK